LYVCSVTAQSYNEKKIAYREAYMLYLLRNGAPPVTVFKFCEELGQPESEFYKAYSSFNALEKDIWLEFFNVVKNTLDQDENYRSYTVYEKWLSFLYTLIEEVKRNRSYVVLKCENLERTHLRPFFLDSFRREFNTFSAELVEQGISSDEIATRPVVTAKYNEVLWVQFLYVLRVWTNDESEDFQVTDAAIEKTSVLLFELMKKGPIDMLIDFVKFAYQNKAY
jgi:hypothetical protein